MKMAAPALKADRPVYKPIPDLSIEATRAELTPAAIEAFLGLSRIWRLTSRQAIALLGEGSERTWFRIKAKEWVGVLSQDSVPRVCAADGSSDLKRKPQAARTGDAGLELRRPRASRGARKRHQRATERAA